MLAIITLVVVVATCTVMCMRHFIANVRMSRTIKRRLFNL